MTIEYKASKAFTMGIDGRTVTGAFCIHGSLDDGDGWSSRDRSHPGLFGDFKVDGRDRVKFLWAHDSNEPPIATIDQLFEISQADLPPIVRQYAPDSTGAVACKRTYLDTPRGNEVLLGIQAGAITEMSYAYQATKWDYEKPPEGSYAMPIRNLYQAEIFDVSDVNHGMHPATSADGSKGLAMAAHGDVVKATVSQYIIRVRELNERRSKEGRVFSSANYAALKSLADDLDSSIAQLRDLLSQSEPKQAIDVQRLMLESQRALAYVNGIRT